MRLQGFSTRSGEGSVSLQRIEGWGLDPEILFLAKKSGFKVAEVPVVWGPRLEN